jgi:UDP-N-acetylglucosamine 2-epimerase (non-hydrolysing)
VRVVCAVGARPNFVKIAPILRAFARAAVDQPNLVVRLVHTGQHYDAALSDVFFADLEIPPPDLNLGVGSGTHAEQTARVLTGFEATLRAERPDLVIVVGDVNSTLACALAAAKLLVPVAHVEAGLRSGDQTMPEEINRILTDALSELCFTTCVEANANLGREGIRAERIHFVGNVMIDSLLRSRPRARRPAVMDALALVPRRYGVLTLHRPANVDRREDTLAVLSAIEPVAKRMPVILPIHPRSRQMFEAHALGGRLAATGRLHLVEPLGYLEFIHLMDHAALVLTDSGGVQEETTVLGVPCLTLRGNTERAITVEEGTNRLVGFDRLAIEAAVEEILAGQWPTGRVPALWDGRAAERIAATVLGPWAAKQGLAP